MTEESRPPAAPAPDDRELQQYLEGDSALSRRYRAASEETAPADLDEAILARARSELRRRPAGISRWLTSVALAASVLLGVNLGWNVYKAAPAPGETAQLQDTAKLPEPGPQAIAPAAPPPAMEVQPEGKTQQAVPSFAPDAPAEGDVAGAGTAERAEQFAAASARRDGDDARHKAEAQQQVLEQERSMQTRPVAPLLREGAAGASADSAAAGSVAPAPSGTHGWWLTGAAPQDYRIGLTDKSQVSGNNSLTIVSRDHPGVAASTAPPRDFGALMHFVPAAPFRGRGLVLEAWVRADGVKEWTGLWLRVDSAERKPLRFENMAQRPIRGTSDWREASLRLEVPAEAESIAFGLVLNGSGRALIDAVRLGPADGGGPEYFYDFEEQQLSAREPSSTPKAAASTAPAAAGPAPSPKPKPWTEAEKIERLIAFIGQLQGAVFIRNDREHSAVDAAKHMRLKLEKAGDRVKTADDFIRLCASHSYVTKEAYLIRFPDGRTRTAEDILREQLATMP